MNHKEIKGHIRSFLRLHYTDERLTMFSAHLDDGGFDIHSCCCFIGIPTADHPFQVEALNVFSSVNGPTHYRLAMKLPGAGDAEAAIFYLQACFGRDGMIRILKVMVQAEMRRRDRLFIKARAGAVSGNDLAAAVVDRLLAVSR